MSKQTKQSTCALIKIKEETFHPNKWFLETSEQSNLLRFILSDRSDFHMTDNLSIADHSYGSSVLSTENDINMRLVKE